MLQYVLIFYVFFAIYFYHILVTTYYMIYRVWVYFVTSLQSIKMHTYILLFHVLLSCLVTAVELTHSLYAIRWYEPLLNYEVWTYVVLPWHLFRHSEQLCVSYTGYDRVIIYPFSHVYGHVRMLTVASGVMLWFSPATPVFSA